MRAQSAARLDVWLSNTLLCFWLNVARSTIVNSIYSRLLSKLVQLNSHHLEILTLFIFLTDVEYRNDCFSTLLNITYYTTTVTIFVAFSWFFNAIGLFEGVSENVLYFLYGPIDVLCYVLSKKNFLSVAFRIRT